MCFKRSIFACLVILLLNSCTKHSSAPATMPIPPPLPVPADSTLTVTMAANDGIVLPTMEADTFLVRIKNPGLINAVPVVYHVGQGATLNEGHQLTDSTWSDTVDLSGNKVHLLKVTGPAGNTKTWGLAFEYKATLAAPMTSGYQVNCIYFTGDTMYLGTQNGLYRSLDMGLTYSLISGLGTGVDVLSVVTQGDSIYAGTATGVSISNNGGSNFTEHVFPSWYQYGAYFPGQAVYKQADTLYVGAGNVDVSYDGGATYMDNVNGLGNLPTPISVWCLYAKGDTVYAGTVFGFAVSYDGSKSFTINSSGLGPGGPGDAQCNGMAIDNGIIYVAAETGLGLSTDGGLNFTEATTANGLGGNVVTAVAVRDSLLAAATLNGLSLSRDGGKSFINLTTLNGIGGNYVTCVSIQKGAIYAGTFDGFNYSIVTLKPR
jgi:hypothetical protein